MCKIFTTNCGIIFDEQIKKAGTMETKVLVICAALGSLGVISALLSFVAETRKVQIVNWRYEYDKYNYCSPNQREATVLGNTSASLLLVAQILVNAVTGCFCCNKHPNTTSANRSIALFCYIFSWVMFVVGFILLVMGAGANSDFYSDDGCNIVKNGIFSAGGLFSLAAVAFGILYYIKLSSPSSNKNEGASDPQQSRETITGQPPPQFLQHPMP